MKKILLQVAFYILLSSVASAQENPSRRTEEYCDVLIIEKSIGNKVYISVDYGQESRKSGEKLKDNSGTPLLFNSPVDALNYMNGQGWELVEIYQNKELKYDNRHFVMKRKLGT